VSDAEAMVSRHSAIIPESLETTTPEEGRRLYRMLRLSVELSLEGEDGC
jgi:hypothetical protein